MVSKGCITINLTKILTQFSIYFFCYVSSIESCVDTLIKSGLQPLLYKLHKVLEDCKTSLDTNTTTPKVPIVLAIPLSLQTLFPLSVLEHASRFQTIQESSSLSSPSSTVLKMPTQKNFRSGVILPITSSVDIHPTHGTTKELFSNGNPGLI